MSASVMQVLDVKNAYSMARRASTRQRDAKLGLIRILGVTLLTLPSGEAVAYTTLIYFEKYLVETISKSKFCQIDFNVY